MAITVKKITLWRREIEDQPGTLARVLAPVADAGTSLRVVMAYRYPEPAGRAAVEMAPVTGRRATRAAEGAGLAPSSIGALLVEGDDRPGLGRTFADALAAASINMHFLMGLVTGRRYAAVFGFASEADADRALPILKKSGAARKSAARARGRASSARRPARKRR